MKVLITGGTGFVGSHVAREFVEAGHKVRVLARRTSDISSIEELGTEIVRGDLAQPNSLRRAIEEVDVLVSLATTMRGTAQEFHAATVQGTLDLFLAAEQADVKRMVHISSIAVLSIDLPQGQREILEDGTFQSDTAFLTSYVAAKQESERIALSFDGHKGIRVVVLRPGIVFGPRGTWKLPRMGYPVGGFFFIIGNGRNLMPVTYVKNLAQAILLAAEKPNVPSGVFNIIDDERFTQREFLERYRRCVRPELKIICVPHWIFLGVAKIVSVGSKITGLPNPFQLGHIVGCYRQLIYSNQKAKSLLGWQPRYGKEEALTGTMRYFARKQKLSRRADSRVLGRTNAVLPPVRVALIGCGNIARTHMQFLAEMPNVRVIACCDPDLASAKRLAQERGIPAVYESAEVMLENEKPEAVHILTPPQMNASLALLAIRNGSHVLVEKPMALNCAEVKTMFEAAAACGVKICVDHNHLYDAVMVEVRRLIEYGTLGRLVWVDSYYGFDLGNNRDNRLMLPGGERNWAFQLPGGLFHNLLPHPLSVALDILGEPTSTSAHARFFGILPHQPTDELRILLETSEASGIVTVSLAASPKFHALTLYGTKGSVFVDFAHKLIIPQIHRTHVPKTLSRFLMNMEWGMKLIRRTLGMSWKIARQKWVHFDGMYTLLREFYAAIQEDRPCPVTSEEVLRVMRVMDTTWEQIGLQNVLAKE